MLYYSAEQGRGVAYGFDLVLLEIWRHIPDS